MKELNSLCSTLTVGQTQTNGYCAALFDSAFRKCVVHSSYKNGSHYSCRKGLWQVGGKDSSYVRGLAYHYFAQYYLDGEYNDLIDAIK